MTIREYASPAAFKQALEQRLKDLCSTGPELARRRQLLVFDRWLARVGEAFGEAAILKGGLVLEARLARARATKDVDLRMTGASHDALPRLQEAGRLALGDYMTFEVGVDPNHPEIDNDGMQYAGKRFVAECRLAGKLYGQRFGIDLGWGDPIVGQPDIITADDVLAFVGVAPPQLRLYPVETHIAEKLHAYTMLRVRPNSRVKDLPDIALLATTGSLNSETLREALEQTFTFRSTHSLPAEVPAAPASWADPYARIARSDGLDWTTLEHVTDAVRKFLDPVLTGGEPTGWDPATWSWTARPQW